MMDNKAIFFPYYINQARLFDLYAILNGGYPEYEEIQSSTSTGSRKEGKASINASSGFHLFKIAGSTSGEIESHKQQGGSATTHRVQTVTSILGLTIERLQNCECITPISKANPGSFVLVPVNLKINSIKTLLGEAKELVKLGRDMSALDKKNQASKGEQQQDSALKQIEQIASIAKGLFNSEEIVPLENGFALFQRAPKMEK